MPQYMLLVYNQVESPLSPEQMAEVGPSFDAYTQGLQAAGVLVAGDALEGVEIATTLRERDGSPHFLIAVLDKELLELAPCVFRRRPRGSVRRPGCSATARNSVSCRRSATVSPVP